ncbi:MAG: DUF502 domain-containing protein [Bacteroidota bacterium]
MKPGKQLFSNLLAYFFRGLLLIVPFALTGYIISLAFHWIDGMVKVNTPGLGIAGLVVFITFLGYLGSTLLVRSILGLVEKLVASIPLISIIYTSFKELTTAFVGNKTQFNKPVLVRLHRQPQVQRLGFVTQQTLGGLHLPESVAVYLPHSYNFSGNLYIVPKDAITPLDVSSTETMKFIISGGITGLPHLEEE